MPRFFMRDSSGEGFNPRHAAVVTRSFRLERLPGGACTRWKALPLHGARQCRSFGSYDFSPKDLEAGASKGARLGPSLIRFNLLFVQRADAIVGYRRWG